jgi:hypothetical protein
LFSYLKNTWFITLSKYSCLPLPGSGALPFFTPMAAHSSSVASPARIFLPMPVV